MNKNDDKQTSLSKRMKIIIVNFLLFLLLFHVADFFAYQKVWQCRWAYENSNEKNIFTYLKYYKKFHNYNFKYDKKEASKLLLSDNYNNAVSENSFRPIENINADKSILIFGCSYAHGDGIKKEETFSKNLGKLLLHYRIYNRAKGGWTTSHMLYQLENKDFSNMANVKYVIYVFIPEHLCRTDYSGHTGVYTPYYNFKNLAFKNYSYKYMSVPVVWYFRDNQMTFQLKDTNNININVIYLSKKIFLKAKKYVVSKFGYDTKLIILRYDNGEDEPYNWMFEELKKEGIIVVSLKDLSDTNYISKTYQISEKDWHPNARAWREITPLFVKYLQDRGYLKD